MTESNEIEFHERVASSDRRQGSTSLPVRAGIFAGTAALLVIGAMTAMGASPAAPSTGGEANPLVAGDRQTGTNVAEPFAHGFRGGFGRGGFHEITIAAISGSNLSLETADGWTRTITVESATTITEAGETITLADLAVGDQIGFNQERQSDGSYTVTAIRVVLPTIAGEVTAVADNSITVTGKDGTTGTIHVDGDTTYTVDGTTDQALSDIIVGSFVVAEGTLRADGSLDADRVHSGMRGFRNGHGGPGWRVDNVDPAATPTPTESSSVS
jgi:hypothetical protein